MALSTRPPRAPDERAFHQAIERGGNAWYAACLRITGDPSQAQDAVQEGLLNAWSQRRQFRGGARLETWIHRITVNSALGMLRRQRPEVSADEVAETPTGEPGPAAIVATHELGVDLDRALTQLSPLERTCFVLKHLEQWRLSEVAEELATSVGSVKQALFRAVAKLRGEMTHLRSET